MLVEGPFENVALRGMEAWRSLLKLPSGVAREMSAYMGGEGKRT